MDYFWNPNLYQVENYHPTLFSTVLPSFAENNIIRKCNEYHDEGGDILLPFTSYFFVEMMKHLQQLCKWFIISFIHELKEVPLWLCTQKFTKIYEELLGGKDMWSQENYMKVTVASIKQTYQDTGLNWSLFNEFFEVVENIETIRYIKFKALEQNQHLLVILDNEELLFLKLEFLMVLVDHVHDSPQSQYHKHFQHL